eukprot:scaffold11198_cov103-Skeletonema_dohrnii-CCMP3373.AAC.2
MSSSPRKVSLLADADYIKRIYSDDKSFQPCTTCSFTTNYEHNNGHDGHDEHNDNHHHQQQQHFITIKATERQKLQNIINRRISKFYNLFDPMIDFLLINRYALLNKQRNHHVETIPTDHIIVMHLADLLPNSSNAAIPPQLRIDKLEPRAVADLNDAERSMLEHDLSWQKKPEEVRIAHLVSYKLLSSVGHHHHVWTTVRTNSYDFNPLIVGRAGQRALMERLIAFSQGINEIARGDRPDIYDMIKRQMKEARRRSRDDEASGGVSSLGSSTCCCVEESSSCGENDLDKENNSMCLMSKTRRRRSDDGNELTAKTCWRER